MVIDSLNLKMVSNFTNLLRLAPPPPQYWKSWSQPLQMDNEIARLVLHGADEQFSIAFMFSTIYLRLEGKVPSPPPRIEIFFLNMNTIDSLAF